MAKDTEAKASKKNAINLKNTRRAVAFMVTIAAAAYGTKAFLSQLNSLPEWAIAAGTVAVVGFLVISIFDK